MNLDTPIIPIVSPDPVDDRPAAIYVHGLASGARAQPSIHLLANWSNTDG